MLPQWQLPAMSMDSSRLQRRRFDVHPCLDARGQRHRDARAGIATFVFVPPNVASCTAGFCNDPYENTQGMWLTTGDWGGILLQLGAYCEIQFAQPRGDDVRHARGRVTKVGGRN